MTKGVSRWSSARHCFYNWATNRRRPHRQGHVALVFSHQPSHRSFSRLCPYLFFQSSQTEPERQQFPNMASTSSRTRSSRNTDFHSLHCLLPPRPSMGRLTVSLERCTNRCFVHRFWSSTYHLGWNPGLDGDRRNGGSAYRLPAKYHRWDLVRALCRRCIVYLGLLPPHLGPGN